MILLWIITTAAYCCILRLELNEANRMITYWFTRNNELTSQNSTLQKQVQWLKAENKVLHDNEKGIQATDIGAV